MLHNVFSPFSPISFSAFLPSFFSLKDWVWNGFFSQKHITSLWNKRLLNLIITPLHFLPGNSWCLASSEFMLKFTYFEKAIIVVLTLMNKFIINSSSLRIFKFISAWSDLKLFYGKIELRVKSRCPKFSLLDNIHQFLGWVELSIKQF